MELVQVSPPTKLVEHKTLEVSRERQYSNNNPFIEANTLAVNQHHLKKECIIPVFSKDNERTLSHNEFIEVAQESLTSMLPNQTIEQPEIRISHQIKGRIPSAIHKTAQELLEHEKTIYYERMAFIIRIPGIRANIGGNNLALTLGGVRAYNRENLFAKKSVEKFQVFIGFQNMVCCNLCVSTDGNASELRVSSITELASKIKELISHFDAQKQMKQMKSLTEHSLTEKQFAQLIGRAKLYQYLAKADKKKIPELLLNEGQISTIAKDYYQDQRFCRNQDGTINLWKLYNLFTSANKSSYIDTFCDRNVNAFSFANGIASTLQGDSNHLWFLS